MNSLPDGSVSLRSAGRLIVARGACTKDVIAFYALLAEGFVKISTNLKGEPNE